MTLEIWILLNSCSKDDINNLELFPHQQIMFQRSRLLGFAWGRVPGCVGVVASWDLLWTVHFWYKKMYTLQSDYFGFGLIFWLLKFLKWWTVIIAGMLQRGMWPQGFPPKLCITAPCGNTTVCCNCSPHFRCGFLTQVSEIHVPPLCPVPHRGEGVNKAGCMNCAMLAVVTDINTDSLKDTINMTSWN